MENRDKNDGLVDLAYNQISDMIFKCALPPGAPVSDFALSKKLNISRTPIRSAILILESKGIIERTEKGFRVAKVSKKRIDDVYEARKVLEVGALTCAIERGVSKESLSELRSEIVEEEKCLGNRDYYMALTHDLEFHRKLVALCGNPILEKSYCNLKLQQRFLNMFSLATPNDNAAEDYYQICDMIEKGDVHESARLLEETLKNGKEQKLRAIDRFGMEGLEGMFNYIASYFGVGKNK